MTLQQGRGKFISYAQAETYCCDLAKRLARYFGGDIGTIMATGIPRGGIIVLGMISYALNLRRDQILSGQGFVENRLLLIVDDCSLSGRRFLEFVKHVRAEKIVFAHLTSSVEVREEIMAADTRVIACFSAMDVKVARIELDGARENVLPARDRDGGLKEFYAAVEPLAFAWGEPYYPIWNAKSNSHDVEWHHVTPRLCLEARAALGFCGIASTEGCYDVPDGVLWKKDDDGLWIWKKASDAVYKLNNTAGEMWGALLVLGSAEATAEYIGDYYSVTKENAYDDVCTALREFLGQGLLSETVAA